MKKKKKLTKIEIKRKKYLKAYRKAYYKKHKKEMTRKCLAWMKNNPERRSLHNKRYRDKTK